MPAARGGGGRGLSLRPPRQDFGGVAGRRRRRPRHSRAGELRGIIGPNGCGKTTLFNLITGYLQPESGRVVFEGEDLPGRRSNIARPGIVRKFQVPSLFGGLTAEDNLRIAGVAEPSERPRGSIVGGGRQTAGTQLMARSNGWNSP